MESLDPRRRHGTRRYREQQTSEYRDGEQTRADPRADLREVRNAKFALQHAPESEPGKAAAEFVAIDRLGMVGWICEWIIQFVLRQPRLAFLRGLGYGRV